MKARPDFFIVGAPKCGTTAMADYLGQHPEIAMCRMKELHYFGADIQDKLSFRASLTERDYLSFFSPRRGERRVGEASVGYLYSRDAPGEILEFCDHADIVIMLRNPVEMVYSLHSQLVYRGNETEGDFEAAIELDEARRSGAAPLPSAFPPGSYRSAVAYTEHAKRYLDLFGRERVHFVIFDELKAQPLREYERLCEFLGVDPAFVPEVDVVNPNKQVRSARLRKPIEWLSNTPHSATPRRMIRAVTPRAARNAAMRSLLRLNTTYGPRSPMPPELRERLTREFAPEVNRLSELLGVDLRHWSDVGGLTAR